MALFLASFRKVEFLTNMRLDTIKQLRSFPAAVARVQASPIAHGAASSVHEGDDREEREYLRRRAVFNIREECYLSLSNRPYVYFFSLRSGELRITEVVDLDIPGVP